MKKLLLAVLLILTTTIFTFSRPAFAGDAAKGKQVFSANCNACHLGGNNVVNASKTLKKEALEKYGMNSIEKIKYQVKNGKNAMPAFGGRLSEQDIENVATYVLAQSEKGW